MSDDQATLVGKDQSRGRRLAVAAWYIFIACAIGTFAFNKIIANRLYAPRTKIAVAMVEIRPAPRSIGPVADFKHRVDTEKLARFISKLRPHSFKPSMVSVRMSTHALRLWGADAAFDGGGFILEGFPDLLYSYSSRTMLSMLINGDEFESMYPNASPLLTWTKTGVALKRHTGSTDDIPISMWPDHEVHTDKVISVLGEIGIRSDHQVRAEGRDGAVTDILRESMLNFTMGQEKDWSAKAYLYYLARPSAHWTNRFDQVVSVEKILEDAARTDLGSGICEGTHPVHSLALASRIDREEPFLPDHLRAEVSGRLKLISSSLERSQATDGAWSADWGGLGTARPNDAEPGVVVQLRATGHHLEWIAIVPEDLRPSDACIARAIRFVEDTMDNIPGSYYYLYYPPLSHAGRALVSLSGRDAFSLFREGGH